MNTNIAANGPVVPESIEEILRNADNVYYFKGASPMSDVDYSGLVRAYEQETGRRYIPKHLASRPNSLPIHMGSINKIKDNSNSTKTVDERIAKWKSTHDEFVVSDKLDGVSGLYYKDSSGCSRLYSRTGFDLTHILSNFINTDNVILGKNEGFRGEFIMKRTVFESKYSDKYKNARNLVAGQINRKPGNTDKDTLRDIDFVLYEFISNSPEVFSVGLDRLESMSLSTVYHSIVSGDTVDAGYLTKELGIRRTTGLYEIDGIVVTMNKANERSDICPRGNPLYAIAFKIDCGGVFVTVDHIDWNVQKTGKIVPLVHFDPVSLDGSSVSKVTGINGKFINESELNKGSVIQIIKAGGVIPKIYKIVSRSAKPSTPGVGVFDGVNYYTTPSARKQILYFLKEIGLKNIGKKLVDRIYESGIDTIDKVIGIKTSDLVGIHGIGPVRIQNIVDGVHDHMAAISIDVLASATGIFGNNIGKKRLRVLFSHKDPFDMSVDDITALDGWGPKSSARAYKQLGVFHTFVTRHAF